MSVPFGCNTGSFAIVAGSVSSEPSIDTASVLGACKKIRSHSTIQISSIANETYIEILTAEYDVRRVNVIEN